VRVVEVSSGIAEGAMAMEKTPIEVCSSSICVSVQGNSRTKTTTDSCSHSTNKKVAVDGEIR
jgi:hypothetical protein